MAKISSVEKNNRRKRMSKQFANRRAKLKAVIYNRETTMEERFAAQLKLSALPRNASTTRIRNRCELTGRPRGYYRKLRLCRNMLRELASNGQIPGMVKASW